MIDENVRRNLALNQRFQGPLDSKLALERPFCPGMASSAQNNSLDSRQLRSLWPEFCIDRYSQCVARALRSSSSESHFFDILHLFSHVFWKFHLEWSKTSIKNSSPKSSRRLPWTCPRSSLEPSGGRSGRFREAANISEDFEASRTRPAHVLDVIFGVQPDAAGQPKTMKNALVVQKLVSGSVSGGVFCRFWSHRGLGLLFSLKNSIFSLFLHRFFLKRKTRIKRQTQCFHLGTEPWKSLFFLGKTTIFKESCFFLFIYFCTLPCKNSSKKWCEIKESPFCPKNTKTWVREARCGSKMVWN